MQKEWWDEETIIWYVIIVIGNNHQWMLKIVDKNMHTLGMYIKDSYQLKGKIVTL